MNNNNLYSKKKIIIAVLIVFAVLVAIISLPNNEKVDLTVVNGSPDGGSEQTVLVADGVPHLKYHLLVRPFIFITKPTGEGVVMAGGTFTDKSAAI